jgi:hypothetical protein
MKIYLYNQSNSITLHTSSGLRERENKISLAFDMMGLAAWLELM